MRLKTRERGFGILEMSLALALFTLLLLFSMRDQQRTARLNVDRAAGEHLKTLQLGLQRYLDQNRAALLAGTPIPGVANPLQPTLAELRATNALSPSVGDVGANGLTYQMRVDRLPAGCVPATPCTDVQALMWATAPLLDGGVPQAARLAVMQAAGGNDLGMSNVANPLQIIGQDGVWGFANPLGNQGGVIVARAGLGSSTDLGAFLRRDGSDAGMVGNLNMNNNRIDAVAEVAAPATGEVRFTVAGAQVARVQANGLSVSNSLEFQNLVPVGGGCAPAGAIGRVSTPDGNGVALCQGGVWRTIAIQSVLGGACATNGASAVGLGGEQIVCVGGTYVSILSRLPRVVDLGQLKVSHGDTLAKPACGPGGTANITLVPQDPGTDPSWNGFGAFGEANRLRMLPDDTGATWTITLGLVDENNNFFSSRRSGTPYNLQAIARIQCFY